MAVIKTVIDWVVANWPTISAIISQVVQNIQSLFTNVLIPVFNFALAIIKSVVAWVVSNWPTIKAVITTVLNIVLGVIKNVLVPAMTLIISIMGTVVNWIKSNWPLITGVIQTVINGIRTAWGAVKAILIDPITSAFNKISEIVTKIKGFFSNMSLKIPSISLPKLPSPSITGSFSLGPPPTVPHLSWNAKGGIFDKPTLAGLGERGREAIVPLTGNAADTFANAFLSRLQGLQGGSLNMGSGITININGDVKDPAAFAKLISYEIAQATERKTRARGR
jgi:hypothetical protein